MTTSIFSALPERIPFWKMSGCGNDFVVIDNRAGIVPPSRGELTKAVCRHRVSVGADGVVLIQNGRSRQRRGFRLALYQRRRQ